MKKLLHQIKQVLHKKEITKMKQLMVMDALICLLDIVFIAALLGVISFYTGAHQATGPQRFPFLADLNQFFIQHPLLPILVFFFLFAIKNILAVMVFSAQSKFMYGVASRISGDHLGHYLDGDYLDYVNIDSSAQTRRISQQPIEFCYYILGSIQQIMSQGVLVTLTVVAIVVFNPFLFFLLLVILAPPVILCGMLLKKKLSGVRKHSAVISRQTIQFLQEALSGFVESNMYQRKSFFTRRYQASQEKFNDFLSTQRVVQNLPARLMEVFAIFGLLLLVMISSFTTGSAITFLTLGAFMAGAYKIIPGIVKIMNHIGQIKTYGYTITDMMVKDDAATHPVHMKHARIETMAFQNVDFSYRDKPVLKHVSFTIHQGDFIGFSGVSGKGKTTLIHLLLGFLKPTSGKISVNGILSGEEERQQFWSRISYIKQQPFFIHDTAIRNVVLTEHEVDEQKWNVASAVSGFHTFINGDATKVIRENGKNISGGQRQRIAFARALYKDFDLMILDEPFSEMDGDAETEILEKLQELAQQGKIIILVTHNQDSLKYCNKIITIGNDV